MWDKRQIASTKIKMSRRINTYNFKAETEKNRTENEVENISFEICTVSVQKTKKQNNENK